jgi:hypothetical protein
MYGDSRSCCMQCNGYGVVETTMEEYNELKDCGSSVNPLEKECPSCGGSGYVSNFDSEIELAKK